jgi:hypothetical protein
LYSTIARHVSLQIEVNVDRRKLNQKGNEIMSGLCTDEHVAFYYAFIPSVYTTSMIALHTKILIFS